MPSHKEHATCTRNGTSPLLTTVLPLFALATTNAAAGKPTVLLLGDDGSEQQVEAALADAGHDVTFAGAHDDWNGANPNINDFDVVVYLDGYSYGNNLQPDAQTAMDAFVRSGGGLVNTEWATYDAYNSAWNPLIARLLPTTSPDRDYDEGTSWRLIDTSHQLSAWLPAHWADQAAFSYVVPHANATVIIESHNGDPLVTYRKDLGGTVVHVNRDMTYTTSIINGYGLQAMATPSSSLREPYRRIATATATRTSSTSPTTSTRTGTLTASRTRAMLTATTTACRTILIYVPPPVPDSAALVRSTRAHLPSIEWPLAIPANRGQSPCRSPCRFQARRTPRST